MPIDSSHKITEQHTNRDAFLYVRQSSLRQIIENTESTKRQYALRERAIALGWPIERIHTIDRDLGKSGAESVNRDGFQQLVTEVALGNAGIVLGLEVSRLARNNADWHRLLELAALGRTLILDEDGIYDPREPNDRLLLGIKGTLSEAELHVLKARLHGGIINKASRGELEIPLPIGFVYQDNGSVTLDPDQQIQNAIRLVFESFKQLSSAMAVVRKFADENILFPRRIRGSSNKGDIVWGEMQHARVLQILHNPRYAGAFVFGRTRSGRTADLKCTQIKVARADWQVFIPKTHEGYIDLETFEYNQVKLANNAMSLNPASRGSVAREGSALLQGRVICGICGSRIRVRYSSHGHGQLEPYYACAEASVRKAGKLCQYVRGVNIDAAVCALLQEVFTPAAIEVALAVQQELAERAQHIDELRQQQFERARYEAELAKRRYLKVDPDNRLVADTLEADWNEKLRLLNQLQQEQDQQRKTDSSLLPKDAASHIINLEKDFARIWSDPCIPALERKRIIAYLIEDVTLIKKEQITLHVRFKGGKTHTLSMPRPMPIAMLRKTRPEIVAVLDQLLDTGTDLAATAELNKRGYKNWEGKQLTHEKVRHIRQAYGLKSRFERLREQGFLTGDEMAEKFSVSTTTIHERGREGILRRQLYGNNKLFLYEPLPDNYVFVKRQCGRRSASPNLITVQPAE